MAMLSRQMVVIAVGGSATRVGIQLEAMLRQQLCGPHGENLLAEAHFSERGYQPWQLPEATQFVYVDLADADLNELRAARRVHGEVGERTSHIAEGVRPYHPSLAAVLEVLRGAQLYPFVEEWLAPTWVRQFVLAPPWDGGGGCPSAARAIVHAHGDIGVLADPIAAALGRVAGARGDVVALAGREPLAPEVYVVFSVAGGTGCGLHHDLLILANGLSSMTFGPLGATVVPLVMLPSAFEESRGGGRPNKLNAARALADLGRHVDRLNVSSQGEVLEVRYPDRTVRLTPGAMPSAYVFASGGGLTRDEAQAAIASYVLNRAQEAPPPGGGAVDGGAMAQASELSNGIGRTERARTAIGRRPFTAVATIRLEVPHADIAAAVADRLIADAVTLLDSPAPSESNRPLLVTLLEGLRLGPMIRREGPEVPPVDLEARGRAELVNAAHIRASQMAASVSALRSHLAADMPLMADFDWRAGMLALAAVTDPLRLDRLVRGDARLQGAVEHEGMTGWSHRRSQPPEPRDTRLGVNPPKPDFAATPLWRRTAGGGEEAAAHHRHLETWYEWRCQAAWNEAWRAAATTWSRPLAVMADRSRALAGALTSIHGSAHDGGPGSPPGRRGLTLVPLFPTDIEDFADQARRRLALEFGLSDDAAAADIVPRCLGPGGWAPVVRTAIDASAAAALVQLRAAVERQVLRVMTASADLAPLLPDLADTLRAAVAGGTDRQLAPHVERLRIELAALIPTGFAPPGAPAPLSIRVRHPGAADPSVNELIGRWLNLPAGKEVDVQFEQGQPDAVVVVLRRTELGLTDLPEHRQLLRLEDEARRHSSEDDYLAWRGGRSRWNPWNLMASPEDQVRIVFSFLNALREDLVEVLAGPDDSPVQILIRQQGTPAGRTLTIPLEAFGDGGSWGNLIPAYERLALSDDAADIDALDALHRVRVLGLATGSAPVPAALYETFLKVADAEPGRLRAYRASLPETARRLADDIIGFWEVTVPGALDRPFDEVASHYACHRDLRQP